MTVTARSLTTMMACVLAVTLVGHDAAGQSDGRLRSGNSSSSGFLLLELTVKATVDGQPVAGSWTVPATRQESTSSKCEFVRTMNPLYRLVPCNIEETTTRALVTPFRTAFLRLPRNGGLAIDFGSLNLKMNGDGEPSPWMQVREREPFYFLDSFDSPRILTDYWQASQGTQCADHARLSGCRIEAKITLSTKGSGPAGASLGVTDVVDGHAQQLRQFGLVRPAPLIFVTRQARVFQSPILREDSTLRSLLDLKVPGPSIVSVEASAIRHLSSLTDKRVQVLDLEYRDGKRWAMPTASPSRDNKPAQTDHPMIFYRTTVLGEHDITCCSRPAETIKGGALELVSGEIEYRGRTYQHETRPQKSAPNTSLALVDMDAGFVAVISSPRAKAYWMLRD